MKVKTSITLTAEALRLIDRLGGKSANRSQVIERAVRIYAASVAKRARNDRDRAILDEQADELNAEVEDALDFQADVA